MRGALENSFNGNGAPLPIGVNFPGMVHNGSVPMMLLLVGLCRGKVNQKFLNDF